MKRQPLIAACALAAAACLMPLGRCAELITLRNGFQMQCDRHAVAGSSVRIYLTAGNDNYLELPPAEIVSVSQIATPLKGTDFSPYISGAERRRALDAAEKGQIASEGGIGSSHPGLKPTQLAELMRGLKPPPPSEKILSAHFVAPLGSYSPNSSGRSAIAQPALTPADLRQMLSKAGRSHNLDVDLLASVVHAESGGNPRAVSRAGARGLMQLMPDTAAALGVQNSFQPQQNVGGGSAYLDFLVARYSDNLALALAAYNAGPEAVDRYGGIPPYPETRAYVARVIHEFNRRVLARRAAAYPLPRKLQAPVSQK